MTNLLLLLLTFVVKYEIDQTGYSAFFILVLSLSFSFSRVCVGQRRTREKDILFSLCVRVRLYVENGEEKKIPIDPRVTRRTTNEIIRW